jgi:type II secretory pathway pseudopilin PulG
MVEYLRAMMVFIDHYQTLITGVLAIAAAFIAADIAKGQLGAAKEQIEVARDQINEAKRQADRDRYGRLRAARASLPAVLSGICKYAADAAEVLWKQRIDTASEPYGHARWEVILPVPTFPNEYLPALERVVELTENDAVANRIEEILREAQVLDARTQGLAHGKTASFEYIIEMVIQAASIYARASSLLDFARRQSETVATDDLWDRTILALTSMQIYDQEVKDVARQQRDSGQSPGEADTRFA